MAGVTSSLGDAHALRSRHPGCVPVVCVMGDNSKAKLLTPATMQWQNYLEALRAREPRACQQNARVLLAGMEPSKEAVLQMLYAQHRSPDGFLYVTLTLDHPTADTKVQVAPLSSQGETQQIYEQLQKSDPASTRQKSGKSVLKRLGAKHPGHVPVICTADPDVGVICRKLLVPDFVLCADLGSVLRGHMQRPHEWTEADWEAAQIFVNQSDRHVVGATTPDVSIGQLHNRCKDTLGVLHLVFRPPESKSPCLSDTPEEASTPATVEAPSSENNGTPRLEGESSSAPLQQFEVSQHSSADDKITLQRLQSKYPGRVPVVCTPDPALEVSSKKCLIPEEVKCVHLVAILQRNTQRPLGWTVDEWKEARLVVAGTQECIHGARSPYVNYTLRELHERFQDTDGVLNLLLRPPSVPNVSPNLPREEENNEAVKVEKDESIYSVAPLEQGQNEETSCQASCVSVVDPYYVSDCDSQADAPIENSKDLLLREGSSVLKDLTSSDECQISKRLLLVEEELAITTQKADAAQQVIHDLLRRERIALEMVERLKREATAADLQNAELEEFSNNHTHECGEKIAIAEMKVEVAERRALAAEQRILELGHNNTELEGLVKVFEELANSSVEASNRSASEAHIRFSQKEAEVSMLLHEVESERAHRQAVEQSAKDAEEAVRNAMVEHMLLSKELESMTERCRVSELGLKETLGEQESIAEHLSVMKEKCCAAELRAQSSEESVRVAEAAIWRMQEEARRAAEAAAAEEIAFTSSYVQISTPHTSSTEDDDGFSLI